MPKTYERAGAAVCNTMQAVLDEHHLDLRRNRVRVDVLFVSDIDEDSGEVTPCLEEHGYPAAACVKVNAPPLRALGLGDALITIDAAVWAGLGTADRAALLDHELMHLEIKTKDGEVVTDDQGRPALKLRKHDWQLGGFVDIAARHGSCALEVQAVRKCRGPGGQYFWDFADEPARVRVDAGVAEAARDFKRLADDSGMTVSVSVDGGDEVVVAEPRSKSQARRLAVQDAAPKRARAVEAPAP